MHKGTHIFLLLIAFSGFGQKITILKGRVIVNSLELEAIHIVNLTKQIGVITNESGYFEIKATPGDKIAFSSVQFQLKEYMVTSQDLESGDLRIFLEPLVNELSEVRISQYLLVARPDDAQSPVENLVLRDGNNQAGVSIDLGLLINLISGVFKKKPEGLPSKALLTDYYKEDFFVKELKIPETALYDFIDFLNEETNLKPILKTKDGLKILEFLMIQSKVFKETYGIEE